MSFEQENSAGLTEAERILKVLSSMNIGERIALMLRMQSNGLDTLFKQLEQVTSQIKDIQTQLTQIETSYRILELRQELEQAEEAYYQAQINTLTSSQTVNQFWDAYVKATREYNNQLTVYEQDQQRIELEAQETELIMQQEELLIAVGNKIAPIQDDFEQ